SKLDSNGNYQWAKGVGGNFSDSVKALTLDQSGNVYITGNFEDLADFDPGAAVVNLDAGSFGSAAFVLKLDGSGNFVWAKQMGGTGQAIGSSRVFSYAIQVDSADNVYTAGSFFGTADFDSSVGVATLTAKDFSEDIFITKLDATGNFVWVKQIGNSGADAAVDLRVDAASQLYLTGLFTGTVDFDPNQGIRSLTGAGQGDVFVAKLSGDGNLLWVKGMGGNANDVATSLALDNVGSVYTVGYFRGSADFDPGNQTALLEGGTTLNFFLSKLSPIPRNLEVIWQDQQTGELVLWQLNGLSYAQRSPVTSNGTPIFTGAGWKMHGLHDFDGDGKEDWLWRNREQDATFIWLMNGNAIKSSQEIRLGSNTGEILKPGSNWELKGLENFTNEPSGMRLVWRDSTNGAIVLWGLTGTAVNPNLSGPITIGGNPLVPGSQWELISCQDVDNDGKADLIWNDRSFGVIVLGKMDGSVVVSTTILTPPSGAGWQFAAIGDVNRNGSPELLWQNTTTNEIAVSIVAALTVNSTTVRSSVLSRSDRLTGIQDVNGDGQMELVWYNLETGKLTLETIANTFATVGQMENLPVLGKQWQIKMIDELIV
ncbi:MAG: FG-GAP-like repeat-containing protein, partial [Synechococcales bacterium]|nr:FG-GAP-like repeat-containing protein [Synechococcales bacterium]